MQVVTSLVGSSLLPSTSDLASIVPIDDSSSSLGSHRMIIGAKVCIFKIHHPANLGILGSSRLLSALLTST